MANTYEYLPVPGVSGEYGAYTSPELLYSYAKFTQKGATLKGGQGVLLLGTLMEKEAGVNGKWIRATAPAKASGFLRRSADTGGAGAADQSGNVVISGIVKLEIVEAANGGAGSADAAVTALSGRKDDTYKFISF